MKHVKIVPYLWFDRNAKEAVDFYISVFKNSKHLNHNVIDDTPSGQADIYTFELSGQEFTAINGGPMFRFSQATSLFVYCGSDEEIERLYRQMGTVYKGLETSSWLRNWPGIPISQSLSATRISRMTPWIRAMGRFLISKCAW